MIVLVALKSISKEDTASVISNLLLEVKAESSLSSKRFENTIKHIMIPDKILTIKKIAKAIAKYLITFCVSFILSPLLQISMWH